MLQRSLRQLQHVVTALVLLVVLLIGAELWLRTVRPIPVPAVACHAEVSDQSCLVASATQHHRMKPLADVVCGDGTIRFRTNSLGLRGPEPSIPAEQGTLRVLLLGDDTVVGAWLRDEHTLSAQLQRHLSDQLTGTVEVVNAGVPGYSPLLSRLQYEQDLAELQADVVVLHLDMSDVADESLYRASLRTEGSRPVCIHPVLSQPSSVRHPVVSLLRGSALVHALQEHLFRSQGDQAGIDRYAWTRSSPGSVESQVRHTIDSVEQLHRSTQARRQMLIVATAPVAWQVMAPDEQPQLSRAWGISGGGPITDDIPFDVLSAWCRDAGVPLCSSVEAFREYESPKKFFRDDCPRLTEYGTALYALTLARRILQTPRVVAGRLKTVH